MDANIVPCPIHFTVSTLRHQQGVIVILRVNPSLIMSSSLNLDIAEQIHPVFA